MKSNIKDTPRGQESVKRERERKSEREKSKHRKINIRFFAHIKLKDQLITVDMSDETDMRLMYSLGLKMLSGITCPEAELNVGPRAILVEKCFWG